MILDQQAHAVQILMDRANDMTKPDRKPRLADDGVGEAIVATVDAKHLLATEGVRLAGLLDNDQRRKPVRIREEIGAQRLGKRADVRVRRSADHELCKGPARDSLEPAAGSPSTASNAAIAGRRVR